MFFNRILSTVPEMIPSIDVQKMLLEQQETLRKLDLLKGEVVKIKVKNMYDASNTLQTPIFDTSQITILNKAEGFFNVMDKIGYYISHPILIANVVAGASYWVCLIIAMGGVLYYIIGHKKGLKYTSGSILTYTLIQGVNWGLNLL
jgi:hypothetical protein